MPENNINPNFTHWCELMLAPNIVGPNKTLYSTLVRVTPHSKTGKGSGHFHSGLLPSMYLAGLPQAAASSPLQGNEHTTHHPVLILKLFLSTNSTIAKGDMYN